MKLTDLPEVQRLSARRQRIENDLFLVHAGDLMMIQLDGREPTALKLSLEGSKSAAEQSDDETLFQAIVEVIVMSFEKRRAEIDRRLVELGVQP